MVKVSRNLEKSIFTEWSCNTSWCSKRFHSVIRVLYQKHLHFGSNTRVTDVRLLWHHSFPIHVKQHLILSAEAAQTVRKFIWTPRPFLAFRVDLCSYASGVRYDHDASLSTTAGGLLRFIERGLEFDHKLMHSKAGPGGSPDIWLLGKKHSSISPNN